MKFLLDLSYEEIEQLVISLKEPKFRAKQLFEWINKGASFEEMKNLPKTFIEKLRELNFIDRPIVIEKILESKLDGTKKYLYRLHDGNIIEGVFMKYKYGNTICVSTQVGCRMNCTFCASGLEGLIRNLTPGEILGQVVMVNKDNKIDDERAVTNIVLMGSGEPFDNYDNVTKFLRLVNDEMGLNISLRNVSLSTCGLCDKIMQFADENLPVTLTISLHAPNDNIRKTIMPIAKKFAIKDILKAVNYYFEKTKRRIVFEYSLINGTNDNKACAEELSKILRNLSCHVNLIALNPVKEKGLKSATKDSTKQFLDILNKHKISCTLRRSLGQDIEGACGQLRRKYIKDSKTV